MRFKWVPVVILSLGSVLTLGAAKQQVLPLVQSMRDVIPEEINGFGGQDLTIADDEARVAGFSNYLFRVYELPEEDLAASDSATGGVEGSAAFLPWFSLYVGYYESQAQGNTIHSPKNCLPGAGWEPLTSDPLEIDLGERAVTVNRYILQNESERALVLYWYQGRGRVAHDEYRVKLDLLRDAAFRRRSDEALVRVVVPVETDEESALHLATEAAKIVIPNLDRALPQG